MGPPVFREAQASTKSGPKARPETEVAKVCRQISNVLGKIQSTWNGIMNFVIPVANPKSDFWLHCFDKAGGWEVSPTNSIYKCIRAETNLNPLKVIRGATSTVTLTRIGEIVATVCQIPSGSANSKFIIDQILLVEGKQAFAEKTPFSDTMDAVHVLKSLDERMTSCPLSEKEILLGKTILNVKESKKSSSNKKTGGAAVRLHSAVLTELRPLREKEFYEPILDWLSSSFKTGDRRVLQLVAAERILGEAIKHQDKIFDGEDLIDLVEDIEDEGSNSDW